MALVFSPDRVGMSVGIDVLEAAPVKRISFGVNYNIDRWSPSGLPESLGRFAQSLWDEMSDYFSSEEGRKYLPIIFGAIGGTLGGIPGAAVGGILGEIAEAGAAWKYAAGSTGLPRAPEYTDSWTDKYSGKTTRQDWTNRAQKSLDQIIKPLGLITSATIEFSEPADFVGTTVVAGSAMKAGVVSIGGIAFDTVCSASADQNVRHGLEPILEYYYHHRVSRAGSVATRGGPKTSTTLQFGRTVLKGWVVGMDAEPQSMDFRIWKWSIRLLVDPNYYPQPETEAELREGAKNTSTITMEGPPSVQAEMAARLAGTGTTINNPSGIINRNNQVTAP